MQFYPAKVTQLEHPTKDALTLTLEPQVSDTSLFDYQSGQYLTFDLKIKGKQERRSYSLNTSPVLDELLQVTVKRVKNGLVSNYLHDSVKVGDVLNVSVPSGAFTASIDEQNHRSYYFFAAGSGITPIWSMIQSILTLEPWSYVYLLYGNRDEDNIIFGDLIDEWQQNYSERFVYEPILSQPLSHRWSALLSTRKTWDGKVGRIDQKAVQAFIHVNPPQAQAAKYLICGVGDMIQNVQAALLALDVDKQDILFEYFGSPDDLAQDVSSVDAQLTTHLNGKRESMSVSAGQNLLEAMLAHNIPAPYSCQSGVCGQCKTKLKKGSVQMKAKMALDDKELANDIILPCQAYAQTPQVTLEY